MCNYPISGIVTQTFSRVLPLFAQHLVQEGQHVCVQLLPVQLVVQLMAGVGVELDANVLHPDGPEGLIGLPDALAVAACPPMETT